MRTICAASTLMSSAWPWAPPMGWWIMTRLFGSANLDPFVPPQSKKEAIDALRPTLIVTTRDLMWFIVSKMANPAMTLPPGQLMYR